MVSEHIQPAPGPHGPATPAAAEGHLSTPGVSHEREILNLRLVVWVGVGLVVTAVVVHLAVWGLLVGVEKHGAAPPEGLSELALEDAKRPLAGRLDNVPAPHLEGIERESGLLELRTETGEIQRFVTSTAIHVRVGGHEGRLFGLREGQQVSVTYHLPGGVEGAYGIVTSVSSPPEKESARAENELADAARTLIGTIVRVEPRSVAAAREWAEAQMDRYGWVDQKKGVARIPVRMAMEEVLRSKEFRPSEKQKGDGRFAPPGRSNSGRGPAGEGR
jgi:hypothetical protein